MSEPNEQNVTCDEKGCSNYFFVTGSCLITDQQVEAVGRALGWSFVGEKEAFAHHPRPEKKAKKTSRAK